MTTEYDAFATIYDAQMGTFAADLDFYVGLAKEVEPTSVSQADSISVSQVEPVVLELATGTGRVSLPIARAGVPIVGLDNSVEMLAVARKKLEQEPDLPLHLVQGNMRDFALPASRGRFGLAIIPFRAFLHLTTIADQVTCLTTVHDHLREGGLLALNFFVPDIEIIAAQPTKLGRTVSHQQTFIAPDTGNEIEIWGHRRYRVHEQLIDRRFVYLEWSADGTLLRTTRRRYTLCYIWPREFEHLLARCGFEVEALYGTFDKQPLDENSTEQIWVARKA